MAVGNRVAKKEENLLDFFKHSKRGRKEGGKEKEEQGGDWMDLKEETKGEVDAAKLAKAAFGEDRAGAPEAITDDHSMGEPDESAGEGGTAGDPERRREGKCRDDRLLAGRNQRSGLEGNTTVRKEWQQTIRWKE